MSRGSIPRFDLYEELEVSRAASGEVIEAAYRTLVKRHHPDVSRPADAGRIKRLNVAREWLTSPSRRARYDEATAVANDAAATAGRGAEARSTGGGTGATAGEAPRPTRTSSPQSFGVNSGEVRHLLSELRTIDGARARRLVDAVAALDSTAHAEARSAALAASRAGRTAEWAFAREAASVIARGKLAGSALDAAVAGIVADLAGAIVVRDLLPAATLGVLAAPWTASAGPQPVPAAVPARGRRRDPANLTALAAGAVTAFRGERRPFALGVTGVVLLLLVGLATLGRPPKPEAAVAALTSPPESIALSPGGSPSGPGANPAPSPTPPAWTLEPGASATPVDASGTPSTVGPPPRPIATASRPTLSPSPTGGPTAPPSSPPSIPPTSAPSVTPEPSAAPAPTPTPVMCTVVNLVGVNTSNAQLTWTAAGFTGTVLFSPAPPPNYKIAWQSLAAGTDVPCTSDISVQAVAP